MRLHLVRKPEGEWASFNERCGKGDGVATEFLTPVPAKDARAVLVMRDFSIISPDNRIRSVNEVTGEESFLPDGYKLDTRGEELWIVFDRAPIFGSSVSVSSLGRQVGDAFKVFPMSTKFQKDIEEKQPPSVRKRDLKSVSVNDLHDAGRASFMALVQDWSGIEGDSGPIPCTPENKKAFLDQKDAMFFGLFVSERAGAIRTERMNNFGADSRD